MPSFRHRSGDIFAAVFFHRRFSRVVVNYVGRDLDDTGNVADRGFFFAARFKELLDFSKMVGLNVWPLCCLELLLDM